MGKKKGKKSKQNAENPDMLHEVDKTFYELQIADLNRRLARLRSYSTELEEKVTIFEQAQGKTDADRGDVILYLKRNLQEKTSEALELQDRVVVLETSQESNEEEHQQEIAELKAEFESMREQLVSEVKQITGKLNSLEEFRMQRDDLMTKFEKQENQIEEQELRHKRNMYEVERKFILGKDAIKREMEQQLFQLAKEFESANELRIAATTQRVIRENIVINNELNKLLNTSEEFQRENNVLKAKNKELNSLNHVLDAERNKTLKDFSTQKGIILQMVNEIARQKEIAISQECDIERSKQVEKELKALKMTEEILNDKLKTYEQQMHSIRCDEFRHKKTISMYKKQVTQLKGIIYETMHKAEALLALEQSPQAGKRADFLSEIISTLRNVSNEIPAVESHDTMVSAMHLYEKGDLGFMPRVHRTSKPRAMRLHAESQVGPSFYDFLSKQKEAPAEEAFKDDFVPEALDFDYIEERDSSDETHFSTITEESEISSKDNEKDALTSQMMTQEEVEVEMEEEIEEEELRSANSIDLGGF